MCAVQGAVCVCRQFSTGVADPRGMKPALRLCHCEAPRIEVRGLKAHVRRRSNLVAAESPAKRLLRSARNHDKSKPARSRDLVSS
jgi:hypothetical protein